jgi:hypothetical protein
MKEGIDLFFENVYPANPADGLQPPLTCTVE